MRKRYVGQIAWRGQVFLGRLNQILYRKKQARQGWGLMPVEDRQSPSTPILAQSTYLAKHHSQIKPSYLPFKGLSKFSLSGCWPGGQTQQVACGPFSQDSRTATSHESQRRVHASRLVLW